MIAMGFEMSFFEPWISRDKLERFHTTEEVTPGMPGLEDLGVTPTSLEAAAIFGLRRHRAAKHFEEAVEEAEPAKPII
ncbi:NADH dehydrogenase [ubiquinone] 1 alpha subcomplex subunit 9, mitochondrial-like [Saccoglossus kowalevskii]|uniref:NADH dehydrogenase [ubiquinone] 1 alpha subcomplex subunit 9, mitochondrial-like n=1 Tax=Saccoglossus kowalevskii TaxID=10224 RepID=A0ABM0GZ46_SACKO|nr:PREDICTED: NADH dehydrogenase [ubiquinone] 1 alpha subcomplex subunit 9, mitochondrial-like [Saccoglossus kowalevskii]